MPPWEKYAAPAATGPWEKYGSAPAVQAAPDTEPVPETPPADANSESWLKYATGLTQKIAQGQTSNWGDELAARMGSLGGLGPMIGGKDYDTILSDIHRDEKEFTAAHPKTALAAEIGGALSTGMGTGATAARLLGWTPGLIRSALGAGLTAAPLGALNETGKLEGGDKTIGDYGEAALEGGATAAMFGTGLGAAGHTIARAVGPWASAAAQRLADRGIRLTPGQLIGPNAKKIEDVITSIPGVNVMLRNRRRDTIEDFNREAVNDTLAPLNQRVAPGAAAGHDLIAAAGNEISDAYQRAVPHLRAVRDINMNRDMANIANTLPRDQQDAFNRFVNTELNNVTSGPTGIHIPGDDVQAIIQKFRTRSTELAARGTSQHDYELGRAFGHAAEAVEQNMAVHSPATAVELFQQADAAFANLVRIEKAAGMADEGVFTPNMLKNAVRSSDRSSRKRRVGRGEALMQGLSDDAKVVTGNTLNDSGTPERALMSTLILGGGASMIAPKLLIGPAALAAMYTRGGTGAFQYAATASPNARMAARRAIEAATRVGAPAGGLVATQGD